MRRKLIFFVCLLLIQACAKIPVALEARALIVWCENPENGLTRSKMADGFEYRLQYKPVDYIIAIESKNRPVYEENYRQRIKELGELEYYQLRISTRGSNIDPLVYKVSDERVYFDRDYRFSYEFKQNISMVTCNDSSACLLYSFVQSRGLASHMDLVFAFRQHKGDCDREIRITDNILGTGNMVFTIEADKIKQCPTLIRKR